MKDIWSIVALLVVSAIVIHMATTHSLWREAKVIRYDAMYYYSYLPATFIKKDIKLSFMDDEDFNKKELYTRWPPPRPDGKKVIKTTMGMSILWAPFFFIAHWYVKLFGGYEPDGFSVPYHQMITWASIIYTIMGFFFLRLFLKRIVKDFTVAIVLIIALLGTNLFHYSTIETGMSHAYTFSLLCLTLYLFDRWENKASRLNSIGIGLVLGLIFIIRPVNVFVIIIPLLFRVYSFKTLKERLLFLFKTRLRFIGWIFVFGLLIVSFQLMYWKYVSGSWFYFSYGKERFFFNNPHILEGVLSYRKGWLVYSPVFVFTFLGLVTLFKRAKNYFIPVLVFMSVNLYVVFSWWSWWYGGGFGARALIDTYPIVLIPMAYFIDSMLNWKYLRLVIFPIIVSFVFYSYKQNILYREGFVHWGYMNKKVFWKNFLNRGVYDDYYNDLEPFDDKKAINGEEEYDFDPFKKIN